MTSKTYFKPRPRDLKHYGAKGEETVRAGCGGLSLLSGKAVLEMNLEAPRGYVEIPKGAEVPDILKAVKDNEKHWSLQPARDMALKELSSAYKIFFEAFNQVDLDHILKAVEEQIRKELEKKKKEAPHVSCIITPPNEWRAPLRGVGDKYLARWGN